MRHNLFIRAISLLLMIGMLCPLLMFAPSAAATPASTANATATLAYTIRGLPRGNAIQNFYIGEKYIYITQRSSNTTWLSRLEIRGNEAWYLDDMTLLTFGHAEGFDFYRYNGKEYFLVTTNGNTETTYCWSKQIARIEYEPGKTYNNYWEVERFGNMARATSDGSSLGGDYRVAACVNGDYTIFYIWVNNKKKIVYSIYDTNTLNKLLDESNSSMPSGNSTDTCLAMGDATSAFKYSFTQTSDADNILLPQGIFQGIEMSSLDSIYINGGAEGDIPQIARITYTGKYQKLVNITNVGTHEIEGLQTDRGRVYFLILSSTDKEVNKNTQKIYYVDESVFGITHNISNIPGSPATCTSTGLTDGAVCTKCGQPQDVQETIPMLEHSYDTLADNKNGTHSYVCACGDGITEQHSFVDDVCICGAVQEVGDLEPDPIDVVMDYGKPIEVNVRSRAAVSAVTEEMLQKAPMRAELANPADGIYGDFEVIDSNGDGLADVLRYIPKSFLSKVVTVNAIFSVTFADGIARDVFVPVRIVPGTSVYYESDFSQTALPLDSWTKVGESKEDTQDEGTGKENIYDFVFDRGGEIPSNAFFADFDNNTSRYKTDDTYANTGSKNGYINYDEVLDGNTGIVKNWSYGDTHSTHPSLWWARGWMSFKLLGSDGYAYVQTGNNLNSNFLLNYHPAADHYVQIRFKMKNVVPQTEGGSGLVRMLYYTGAASSSSAIAEGGYTEIPAEAYTSGEFVTLSFPLSGLGADVTKITALRIHFEGVFSKSESEPGEFVIDYIYCGPDNSQNNAPAIHHEYSWVSNTASEYLFYDFDASQVATERYSSSQYLVKTHDTDYTKWVVSTSTAGGTSAVHAVTLNNKIGFIAPNIGRAVNGSNQYSCYVAPTTTEKQFPWNGEKYSSYYTLNYKPNRSKSNYCIVRFKFVDCTNSGGTPGVNCSLIDSAYTIKHPGTTFTYADDQYIVAKINLTSALSETNGTIKNFYLRFYNVINKTTDKIGKVVIDYIYIGPETDMNKIRSTSENSVYVDFTNTVYDQARYAGHTYGGLNLDTADCWSNKDSFSYSFDTVKGILKLTPTSAYAGTGRIEANANYDRSSVRDAMMNYDMTGNDYAIIRMKHVGLNTTGGTPTLKFVVGTGARSGQPGDSGVTARAVSATMNTANNDKWYTYVMDLSAFKSVLGSKITFFRLCFEEAQLNSGGYFQIDYIYIGSKLNAAPPEDSLYFGFDNTASDADRYNSATYGNTNYDTEGASNFTLSSSLESAAISNLDGTMTLTAAAGENSTFSIEPKTNFNFHPKTKAVQIRFKLEGFEPASEEKPYFVLQYGDSYANAAAPKSFDAEALNAGKYITLTLDLNETDAADFNHFNTVSKLRFLFGGMKNAEDTQGKIVVDYIYVGPKDGTLKTDLTYGYDSSYTADPGYSNGSSLFVEGLGLPLLNEDGSVNYEDSDLYTESSFAFTGTGFDIIGSLGQNLGKVCVAIYDKNGQHVKTLKAQCQAQQELSQVPVLSAQNLPYGAYTLKLFVDGTFSFDAIRIYDPIDTAAETEVAELYAKHNEAQPVIKQVSGSLVDKESFTAQGTVEGVLFLSGGTMGSYDSIASENEINLGSNQGISFRLEASEAIPTSVDIGARAFGETAQMSVAVSSIPNVAAAATQSFTIATATRQSYALHIAAENWVLEDGKYYTYITILSQGSLSLTDVKCAYGSDGKGSARLLVDTALLESLGICPKHEFVYTVNEDGTHTVTCTLCDDTITEVHRCGDGEILSRLSCTTDGITRFTCDLCGHSYTETIPASGHRNTTTSVTEVSCTEEGSAEVFCNDCKQVVSYETVAPLGHDEVVSQAVAPTCTESGLTEGRVCNRCGETLAAQEVIPATGHSHFAVVILPTCTEIGCTVYRCPCGDAYATDYVNALGHSYNAAVTGPTCTETGYTTYTCSVCDDSYSEVIPATGHINTSTETTDATCTEDGSVVVTCACGEVVSREVVAALGHSYAYSNNGENHNVTCANCDYAATEDHNYVDGNCICGAVESTEPTLDATLSFGAQLYLENDLTMAFRVKGSKLENYDVSTAYLVVEREVYESGATEAFVVSTTITDYTVSADGRYVFSYPGIAAAQMNDAIRATLYIKDANGKEYVSPVLHTSVATYLDGLLSNSTSDAKLVTLIMDMVNYGAAAQVYFDRHADAPVNEAFQSFKTYASYASANFTTVLEDLSGTTANEGATGKLNQGLDLGTRIGIQYKVTVPSGVNVEDVTLVITDAKGNELETIEVSTGTVDSKGRYIVNFYGSTSKDMRRTVYATAYAKGAAITGTYAYSISSYAWGIQENASTMDANLVAVTRAMMLYGDSASAYFG